MKTEIRNSISSLLLIPLLLACFALLPSVQATPDPGAVGGGNSNAADGFGALNAGVTGINNSGFGANALHSLTIGNNNAAQGNSALFSNTGGTKNTALGVLALRLNVSGDDNVAVGYRALQSTNGDLNVAVGSLALASIGTASANVAVGAQALFSNTLAGGNTAVGFQALSQATGASNIALGFGAGSAVTEGSNNIDIGNNGAVEGDTIRIGVNSGVGSQTACYIAGITAQAATGGVPVVVNSQGKLGTTIASSERFKQEIKPMNKASDAILALKPVTFRYKQEFDPVGVPQFGLIAEQVEKVNPDLVVRDPKGEVNGVRYEAVNAMLLNEFLKEHRKNEEQEKTIAELKSGMTALAATVKEQASQIQKVSAQLEASKPAPQVVNNP
jgi:hypothetical protein